jgi:2-dehydro-3-deoxy-D-gluconate 5-dehydrogenase
MSVVDPFSLHGQTAVVTGGGRGLGRGITESLLAAGADVIVLARRSSDDDLTTYAADLGRSLSLVELDLADRAAIAAEVPRLLRSTRVDILVNNAGIQIRHPAAEFPLDDFDAVLNVNLRAVFDLCQRFATPMLERGHGKIINIASITTYQGGVYVPAYTATKGAIGQLTMALCNEWSARHVNVNAIAPGYMDTDLNEALIADPVRSEQISVRIPAGRWGKPSDIGGAAVFLASSAADYIHGVTLPVDGGWLSR